MVEPFHPPLRQRIFNRVLCSLTRLGIPIEPFSIVVVRGRKTGKPYAFPVTLVTQDGKRWLVSAYGEVSWVWNVRAAGEVIVTRGRRRERLMIRELSPEKAAPVLKDYLTRFFPFVHAYFAVTPEAEVAAFIPEASRHPVFQLMDQPQHAH